VIQSVNINKADADTLASKLSGVGIRRAKAIVNYRSTYGPFLTVDDLIEVKGVGQSVLDKNRDRITLE
jgi:competence protein ComEA